MSLSAVYCPKQEVVSGEQGRRSWNSSCVEGCWLMSIDIAVSFNNDLVSMMVCGLLYRDEVLPDLSACPVWPLTVPFGVVWSKAIIEECGSNWMWLKSLSINSVKNMILWGYASVFFIQMHMVQGHWVEMQKLPSSLQPNYSMTFGQDPSPFCSCFPCPLDCKLCRQGTSYCSMSI